MRKIVQGQKDSTGAYIKDEPAPLLPSLDDIIADGVVNLKRIMDKISGECARGYPERETVQNLKDVLTMLTDLKKKEQDLMDTMSDDELRKIVKNETKTKEKQKF